MDAIQLLEYRCKCGKLLFKGVLFLGLVEVKCRRCGEKLFVKEFESGICTYIECDTRLRVTEVSKKMCSMLGYQKEELIGKEIGIFFPVFRGRGLNHIAHNMHVREVRNSSFILRDGNSVPSKSFLVPKRENGIFSGYKILNWLTESN